MPPRSRSTTGASAIAALLAGFFLFLACPTNAATTGDGPVFRTISVAEGLPDSRPEAIVQDAFGYIWIGTQSGLVRHEGGRFRVIGAPSDQGQGLPASNVMSLLAHSDGTVWAALEGRGAVRIGPDGRIDHVLDTSEHGGRLPPYEIWSMAEDCSGRVWLAFMRGGVGVYDPVDDSFERFAQNADSGLDADGFQLHITVDSACRVWLVRTQGVAILLPQQSRFETLHVPDAGRIPLHLAEIDGRIYFSERGALYDLGPVPTASKGHARKLFEIDSTITGIAADPHSGDMVLSSMDGLLRWHPQTGGQPEIIRAVTGLRDGLPTNRLQGILIDHEGGHWLPTSRKGVIYMAPGAMAFERHEPAAGQSGPNSLSVDPVTALAWDAESDLFWVGSFNGYVETLAVGDDRPDHGDLPARLREKLGYVVVALRPDGEHLLAASQTAVVRARRDGTGPIEELMRRDEPDDGTFSGVDRLEDGRLWITTRDRGLFLIDPETGERVHFHPDGEGIRRLPENSPRALRQGPGGAWWLVGEQGLYRWRPGHGFERRLAPDRGVLSDAIWLGNELWAATADRLHRWRWNGDSFEHRFELPLADRLPPGRVLNIVADETGTIWLVRSSGLAMFRPGDGQLRHLSRKDGLAPVEFQGNTVVKLPDGRVAAAGRGGMVVIDPQRVRGIQTAPRVHVTRLQAGDRVVAIGPGSNPPIELAHDNNSLFVDYLANSFVAPERIRYRIRLAGWDEGWLELIGQTRHYYSSLPPGRYRFQVQAAAPDGPWNEAGDEIEIIVRSPPWLTGWAIGAYILFAVTGTGLGLRAWQRARRRRREYREARQKRALAEEQRQVITRLNHSLEPLELAETVAREVMRVTGGRSACIGFVDERLPRDIVCVGEAPADPSREGWRRGLAAADGETSLAVSLQVERRDAARVLVQAGEGGFASDAFERLPLLEEMIGQALYNAMLLQRVRALAERAEQASSAKSEFLATMSHEIRTPLHGVLGMVDLLYETETEPGQQDILDTLRQSGLQLQRIIDDVLDISRIEAGRLSLNAQPFDLLATLEQVVDLHAPNAARKGLDLRLRIASDLPLTAVGDSDRLLQVLGNLLSNAVKFTAEGGIELVAETAADGRLVLIVADSGPGIGAEDRERLFEPFTQLDASITRSHSGSGLGLAICRRLVEAMGGTLDLMPACGAGARFRVRLPAFEDVSEPLPESMTGLLEGMRLAARLSPPAMRVLGRLGRRWGIEIVSASGRPRECSLLLVDPLAAREPEAADLRAWRDRAEALAWLLSPFQSRQAGVEALPDDARFLRWPLVESRLIGLLLDLRITRR